MYTFGKVFMRHGISFGNFYASGYRVWRGFLHTTLTSPVKYPSLTQILMPGFHMIVTVGDTSPRQARGHIGDSCVKWKHFLSDVSDVADQTGTVRGCI